MPVVKIQIPIATNDPNPRCLIYEKGKKNMVQQFVSQKVIDAMHGDNRAFFEAELDGGRWIIMSRRLPEQFW